MTTTLSFWQTLFAGVRRTYRSRLKRMRIVGGAANVALTATGLAQGDKVFALTVMGGNRTLNERTAIGTAKGTSTTNEEVMDSYVFAIGKFSVGKKYRVSGSCRFTATHSTDTGIVRIRLGATTLTGDIIAAAAARDVADNDIVNFQLELTVRSVTEVQVSGWCSVSGASVPGTTAGPACLAQFKNATVTTNATTAVRLEATVQMSVSDAGNACAMERFSVEEVVSSAMTAISEDEITIGTDTLTLSTTSTAGQELDLLYVDLTP